MQGDKKSYENIQNLGYQLRKLPSDMQNKITEVLLALISKHKKYFSFGFDLDYLIKNNSFKNLLKDITSLEQMKDVITNSNTSIKLSTIEGWDEFLKDVPSKDESVPITSTIPLKTYKFEHKEDSEFLGNKRF